MKAYWKYQCDYGHRWEFMREEDSEELPGDAICPHGHTAVTLYKVLPVDEVVISFLPAGVIIDRASRQLSSQGKYRLELTDRVGGDEHRRSGQTYNWLEVVQLANKFHGLTKDKAWQLWERLGI